MRNCTVFYGIDENYFSERNCIYTAEEIAQQPAIWHGLIDSLLNRQGEVSAFIKESGDIRKRRVILTGAGSSAFVGDALMPLIAKSAGLRTESIHSTEIVSDPEAYLSSDIPTLLVSFARSGNSPESSGAVECARAVVKDLFEVAILCNRESSLYNLTAGSGKRLTLLMPEAANDKGFAMTSSVSSMLLAGYALFNHEKIDGIAKDIALLAKDITEKSPEYTGLASKLAGMDFDRACYLGSGFLKHLAHEAALKMMELTNGAVNSSYESATGFRHGPKSVIKDKTLTVHMISNDPFTAKYDVDLLKEVYKEKKGNTVIAISGENVIADEIISVENTGYSLAADICTGLQALIFCQMLAMFKSLSLGVNTDDPSPGGEVNRVVKGVNIYEYRKRK